MVNQIVHYIGTFYSLLILNGKPNCELYWNIFLYYDDYYNILCILHFTAHYIQIY